jgi:hypothetical protein
MREIDCRFLKKLLWPCISIFSLQTHPSSLNQGQGSVFKVLQYAKSIPCIEKTPLELFWWKLKNLKNWKNRPKIAKLPFFGSTLILSIQKGRSKSSYAFESCVESLRKWFVQYFRRYLGVRRKTPKYKNSNDLEIFFWKFNFLPIGPQGKNWKNIKNCSSAIRVIDLSNRKTPGKVIFVKIQRTLKSREILDRPIFIFMLWYVYKMLLIKSNKKNKQVFV